MIVLRMNRSFADGSALTLTLPGERAWVRADQPVVRSRVPMRVRSASKPRMNRGEFERAGVV